jgi:hypothetical protein
MNFFKDAVYDPAGVFRTDGGGLHDPFGLNPADPVPDPNAAMLAELSRRMFEESDPLRVSMFGRSNALAANGFDMTGSPAFAGLRSSVDSQFNKAKNNTMANVASGGSLIDALTNLESGRAHSMAQGMSNLSENEINRAISLVTGGANPSAALGGLGQAASLQSQQIMAQQAQQAQAKQGAGAGMGMLLALI